MTTEGMETLRQYHEGRIHLLESELERRLRYRILQTERKIEANKRDQQYEGEQTTYIPTPYRIIRSIMGLLKLGPGDVFCDLGCGYGQVVLYAAAVSNVQYAKGIDIIPERIAEANRMKALHKAARAEFILGDAKDIPLDDGTVFFLFSPFSKETLDIVISKLRQIAKERRIRLVAVGPIVDRLRSESWLRESQVVENMYPTVIFETIEPPQADLLDGSAAPSKTVSADPSERVREQAGKLNKIFRVAA